jgi:hypothetical protein
MANARIYIGNKLGTVQGDLSGYTGDTYTLVGEVESFDGLEDVQNYVAFTAINNSRARNFKTTKAASNININCAFDPDDAGQDAVRAAAADTAQADYNFKVVYNDGDSTSSPIVTPTTVYWGGQVGNNSLPGGSAEDVSKVTYQVSNNTGFTIVMRA